MLNPILINSKKAESELEKIKSQHTLWLQGIQDQSTRVSSLNAENKMKKDIDTKENKEFSMNENKMKMEIETKKLAELNKQKELEIKQQALSM